MSEASDKKPWAVVRSHTGFFLCWGSDIVDDDEEVASLCDTSFDAGKLAKRLNDLRSYFGTQMDEIPVERLVERLDSLENMVAKP